MLNIAVSESLPHTRMYRFLYKHNSIEFIQKKQEEGREYHVLSFFICAIFHVRHKMLSYTFWPVITTTAAWASYLIMVHTSIF